MGLSPPLLLSGFRSGGVESPSEPSPLLRAPCSLASCSILRRICRGGKTQRQPPFLPLLQELASTKKFQNLRSIGKPLALDMGISR